VPRRIEPDPSQFTDQVSSPEINVVLLDLCAHSLHPRPALFRAHLESCVYGARQLVGVRPRVALLSFSTKGSATHPSIGKVQAASALAEKQARDKQLDADFDGELQVDAALVPEIASRKLPDSPVAGKANVLIFPDLNSGNIASKLVQHIGRAHAYGQILLGLDRPAADVSRGSTTHDILGVAAIVGAQSISYDQLYPQAGKRLPGDA